ncbi:MAG: PKD domain-containing protein, partial [Methermicoccaceae archaeon]
EGVDANDNGIGDVPYEADKYPLMAQWRTYTGNNVAPVSIIGLNHSINNVGSPTYFNGSSSHDSDGNITSCAWDFGDGTRANVPSYTHTYAAYLWTGSYQPFVSTLEVWDDSGAVNISSAAVVVYMAGDANGDGVSNILDAALTGLHWNAAYGSASYHDGADMNNDDMVNVLDAAIVGLNWNVRATGGVGFFLP